MTQHMIIADEGARFVIVPSTRKIVVPPVYKIIGSVGDHNSEQLTFECPRYIDGHDVSACTNHFIKWTNALNTTGTSAVEGIAVEDELVFFTWTVPAWVTLAAGTVSITVYFEDIDHEGNLMYRWSTATCKECEIAPSLIEPDYGENMPQPIPIGYLKPDGTVEIQGDGEFDIKPYANARINVTTGFFTINGTWEDDEIEVAVEQIENESSRVVRIGDIFIANESDRIPFYQVQADNDGLSYTAKKVGYMQGIQGERGLQGEQGIQGVQGERGLQGIQGLPGQDGHSPVVNIINGYWYIDGVNTNVKAVGQDGRNGQDGKDGVNGKDGITPHIGADGYWYIGNTNTNVKAKAQDGHTPAITIVDGYWYIDGVNTNQLAQGATGQQGEQGHAPTISIVDGYWHIDGVNTNVRAEGQDGLTPHIGANGNWWIGNTDTGVSPTAAPIATSSNAGIVKPDGTSITVDSDGTIHSVGGSGGGEMVIDLGNFTDVALGSYSAFATGHSFTVSAETLQQINDNFADNALTVIWSVNNVRHFRAKLSYANQTNRTAIYSADAELWSKLSNYADDITLRFCSSVQINAATGEGKLFYTVFDRMFPQPTRPSQVLITPHVQQWTVDGEPLYAFGWDDLPKATTNTFGAVMYDPETLTLKDNGALSVAFKPDGETITTDVDGIMRAAAGGTILIQSTETSGTFPTEELINIVGGGELSLAHSAVVVMTDTIATAYQFSSFDGATATFTYINLSATGISVCTIAPTGADGDGNPIFGYTITTKTF